MSNHIMYSFSIYSGFYHVLESSLIFQCVFLIHHGLICQDDLEPFEQFGLRELWIFIQLILIWIIFSHCRSRANRGFKRKLAVDLAATCHWVHSSSIYHGLNHLVSSWDSCVVHQSVSHSLLITADSSWIHLLYGRSLIVVETLAQVYLHFCKMVQDSTDICNMVYFRWTQSQKFKNRQMPLALTCLTLYLPTHDYIIVMHFFWRADACKSIKYKQ